MRDTSEAESSRRQRPKSSMPVLPWLTLPPSV